MRQKQKIFLKNFVFLTMIVLSSCGKKAEPPVEDKKSLYDNIAQFELSFEQVEVDFFFTKSFFKRTIVLDDRYVSPVAEKYYGDYIHGQMKSSYSLISTEQGKNQIITLKYPLLMNIDEKNERLLGTTLTVNDVPIEPIVEQGYYAPLSQLNDMSVEDISSYIHPTESIENKIFTVLTYENITTESQSLKLIIKNYDNQNGLFVIQEGQPLYRQTNLGFQIHEEILPNEKVTYWLEGNVDSYYEEDSFFTDSYVHPSFSFTKKEVALKHLLEEEAIALNISKDNIYQSFLDARLYRKINSYAITMKDIHFYAESIHPFLLTYQFNLSDIAISKVNIDFCRDVFFYTPADGEKRKEIFCDFLFNPFIKSEYYYATYLSFSSSSLSEAWKVSTFSSGRVSEGNEFDDYQYEIICYSNASDIYLVDQNVKEDDVVDHYEEWHISGMIIGMILMFTLITALTLAIYFAVKKRKKLKGGN